MKKIMLLVFGLFMLANAFSQGIIIIDKPVFRTSYPANCRTKVSLVPISPTTMTLLKNEEPYFQVTTNGGVGKFKLSFDGANIQAASCPPNHFTLNGNMVTCNNNSSPVNYLFRITHTQINEDKAVFTLEFVGVKKVERIEIICITPSGGVAKTPLPPTQSN